MKHLIASILVASLLFTGCSTLTGLNNAEIVAAASIGTSAVLSHITPVARQQAIANYSDYIATVLRTVTGNPTPAQLTDLITNAIPLNVRTQYPEIVTYLVPLVVSNFSLLEQKYGTGKTVQIVNDIATGVEAGAAQYISH